MAMILELGCLTLVLTFCSLAKLAKFARRVKNAKCKKNIKMKNDVTL